jgi:hypothetical protein
MRPRHPIAGLDPRRSQSSAHRLDLLAVAAGITAASLLLIFALVQFTRV